jgi:hypothetical protein
MEDFGLTDSLVNMEVFNHVDDQQTTDSSATFQEIPTIQTTSDQYVTLVCDMGQVDSQ